MEVGRQKALVRKICHGAQAAATGSASALASKFISKGTLKRKTDDKDDHPNKKGMGPSVGDKQLKHPSPPKPSHGVGKGLMIGKGLIIPGAIHRPLTQKDYAIEMVDSIIKETNLDPCADQTTEDLGASSLYDLSRVCPLKLWFYALFIHSFPDGCLDSGIGVEKGALG